MEIHVYFHTEPDSRVTDALAHILTRLNGLTFLETHMSKELDDLTAQVAQNTTIEESAVTLINGLAAKITEAGTDPAKLAALSASLTTSANDLSAAIAANTPAAPAPSM